MKQGSDKWEIYLADSVASKRPKPKNDATVQNNEKQEKNNQQIDGMFSAIGSVQKMRQLTF